MDGTELRHKADWFAGKVEGMTFKAIDDASMMLGWITLSPFSGRYVYRGVTEVAVAGCCIVGTTF